MGEVLEHVDHHYEQTYYPNPDGGNANLTNALQFNAGPKYVYTIIKLISDLILF